MTRVSRAAAEAGEARRGADRASGDETVLDVVDLHKSFGTLEVLAGVSLEVRRGATVAIIGQSGGGKSTFLRCLNLLEQPTSGTISLSGTPVFGPGVQLSRQQLRHLRERIGFVFQSFNLFPHLTALENVTLGLKSVKSMGDSEAVGIAGGLLGRVGLRGKELVLPRALSGGQQQRVAIARALALQPAALLFDEPTSALDPESTRDVLTVMKELAEEGMTMVVVTHELAFARQAADEVMFMDAGRVVERGPAAQVLDDPREARTREFLTSFSLGERAHG